MGRRGRARLEVGVAMAERVAAHLRPRPGLTITGENLGVSGPTPFNRLYEVGATIAQPIELVVVLRVVEPEPTLVADWKALLADPPELWEKSLPASDRPTPAETPATSPNIAADLK